MINSHLNFRHIRQHLDGVVEVNREGPVSAHEKQFQYFKVHDYDDDNKLDGIELSSALTHFHQGQCRAKNRF